MPLEIDNPVELQKLREVALAQQDPSHSPGIIPITEVAELHGVPVRTMVAAFQAAGQRKIDDLSLLRPTDAAKAGRLLRNYNEMKDPVVAAHRRMGDVRVTEFAEMVRLPLDAVLDACLEVNFSPKIANVELWLYPKEQALLWRHFRDAWKAHHALIFRSPASQGNARPSDTLTADPDRWPSKFPLSDLSLQGTASNAAPVNEAIESEIILIPPQHIVNRAINELTFEQPIHDIDGHELRNLLNGGPSVQTGKVTAFQNSLGMKGSSAQDMQTTLDAFAPKSYGVFFQKFLAILRLDEKFERP